MRTSTSTPNDSGQQSLFSALCEAGRHAPHVHPDEIRAVRHVCTGSRSGTVKCRDKEFHLFENEVNGLDMSTASLSGRVNILDRFIPIIPRGMFKRPPHEVPYDVVGIMLNDILTKPIRARHGYYHFPENTEIKTDILSNPIFRGKRVILFSAGQDVLIEGLWWRREEMKLFEKIASMGFLAVTGMNFSLFFGECPSGHALNIKKSLCYCHEFDKLNVWTIPHIYAHNAYQRQRWQDWLLANPSVRMVTINTQLQKSQDGSMDTVFETIRCLLENTKVDIIVHGRARGIPIDLRKRYGKRLHYAASGPIKNALIRKDKSIEDHIRAFLLKIEIPIHFQR